MLPLFLGFIVKKVKSLAHSTSEKVIKSGG